MCIPSHLEEGGGAATSGTGGSGPWALPSSCGRGLSGGGEQAVPGCWVLAPAGRQAGAELLPRHTLRWWVLWGGVSALCGLTTAPHVEQKLEGSQGDSSVWGVMVVAANSRQSSGIFHAPAASLPDYGVCSAWPSTLEAATQQELGGSWSPPRGPLWRCGWPCPGHPAPERLAPLRALFMPSRPRLGHLFEK